MSVGKWNTRECIYSRVYVSVSVDIVEKLSVSFYYRHQPHAHRYEDSSIWVTCRMDRHVYLRTHSPILNYRHLHTDTPAYRHTSLSVSFVYTCGILLIWMSLHMHEHVFRLSTASTDTRILAEYSLFYRALLQKRPIILGSLLIVATPYMQWTLVYSTTHTLAYTPTSLSVSFVCTCDIVLKWMSLYMDGYGFHFSTVSTDTLTYTRL